MEDHRLGDLLRELPREHARPGFTARVLNRLDAPEPRRVPRPALAWAAVATMAVAITAGVWMDARRDALEARRAQRALAEIRAEHERLAQEVEELSQPPVIYLGGNEEVDLVLDLGKVRESEGATLASYHDGTF
jgi:hypothetical protein